MRIRQPSRNQKMILAATGAVLLLVAALSVYVFAAHGKLFGWSPYTTKNSSGTNPPSQEQIDNGAKIKEQSLQNSQTKSGFSGSDQPSAPVSQSDGKSKVEVTITATNQTDNSFQIRSLISVLDTSGTCTLTLRKQSSDTVITRTAGVQALANTGTCKGFDIPLDQLSAGSWQLILTFDSAKLTGSATQTINVK